MLGVGVDSYVALWPEGAWATWSVDDVFNTHIYEITDERDDLANHTLFFWTAVALIRLGGGRMGLRACLGAPLVHCLGVGWLRACLDIPLAHIGGIVVNFGVGWLRACRGLP